MKFQLIAAVAAATVAVASPMAQHHQHKRDAVTDIVRATKVVYQDAVVIVDQHGNPYSTSVRAVSTGVAGTPAQNAAPQSTVVTSQPAQQSSAAPAPSSPAPESSSAPAPPPSSAPAPSPSSAPASSPSSSPAPVPTSSSQAPPPPPPSSSAAPSPSPVSSSSPAPQSSSAPAPSSSGGGSGGEFSGQATYYTPGLGACGITNSDSDKIVALNVDQFHAQSQLSNGNPNCGRGITINYNGKSIDVKVTDSCPGCKYGDLDLSPSAFDELASESEGRIDITWSFTS